MCMHMYFVIVRNRNKIAGELLAHGADPNTRNESGVVPLLIAIALGNYSVLNVLLNSDQLDHHVQVKLTAAEMQ